MRLILLVFFCINSFVCAQANSRLSDVWPEGSRVGRFDKLGSRYQVDRRLVLVPGANWCLLEGKVTRLMTPAWPTGQDWVLPSDLVRKIQAKGWVKKKVAPVKPKWDFKPIVVLDAGHGGKDPGAIGLGGTREKDVVLDVTLRLKKMLLQKGVIVKTTREADIFVDLKHRCVLSNNWKASVFVSLHCNSSRSRELHGYQMLRQSDSISVYSRAEYLKDRFPLHTHTPSPSYNKAVPKFKSHVELMRWKDRESMKLSERLNEVFSHRRSNVTNQKGQNLCVTRETMAPSILVEMDFISNPEVEVRMGTSAWRDRAAKDIFEGIMEYLGRGRQS